MNLKATEQEGQQLSGQERLVAMGNTLVKLENSTQMQISTQRPRDEKKILESALKELDLYPSMAEEVLYNKPVGKDSETKEMKYASGLSIRTAESLGNRWSNSAFGAEIVGEDDESITIAAVFLDYENNTRHVVQARISKFYTTSEKYGKKVVQYTPDRLDLKIKAEQSKLLREIILRSLPAGLKREYENKARTILKGGRLPALRTGVSERFFSIGVTIEKLVDFKKKEISKWSKEDLQELLGIYNAIRDGETTIEAVFGEQKVENAAGKNIEKPDLQIKQENLV